MTYNNNNSQKILFNNALKKHQNGEYHDALNLYQKLLNVNPNFAEIHNNIGLIYNQFNERQLALQSFQKAININKNFVEAHNNLGIFYEEQGDFHKAILHCQKAIEIDPYFSKAYNNLGSSFDEIGEKNKAIESYKKSIELDPNLVEPYNNLGSIFRYSGEYKKSINYYQKAIRVNKNHPKSRKNLGLVYLLLSKFHEGFEEFEWRIMEKNKEEYRDLQLKSSLWKGENLDGKIILILSEQGMGDIIQFARYVYELKEKYDVKIIFRTHKKLIHLFNNSNLNIIGEEDEILTHHYHIYLMSLPKFYYQREKKLLKQYYFINKNKKIFSKWKQKLLKINSPKIGINWQGSKNYKMDRHRSIPLNYFESLFNISGLEFINLQKGFGEEQIKNFKYKDKLYNFSSIVDTSQNSFEDTLEIIRNLDLVITPDTAIAHLSSSLGIKTWIIISPYGLDWRWFLNKEETPWYKNTRLFRQKKESNWSLVMDQVKEELIKEFYM